MLLDAQANVNAKNLLERRPLHCAAVVGRVDMGAHLLKAGASADAVDAHGWSARQLAELHGHRAFQELLIRVTSKESQVVIKELPPAPWHGALWDQVVASNLKAHADDAKAKALQEQTAREVAIARKRATDARALEKEAERLETLRQRRLLKERRERQQEELRLLLCRDALGSLEITFGEEGGGNSGGMRGTDGKKKRAPPPPSLVGMSTPQEVLVRIYMCVGVCFLFLTFFLSPCFVVIVVLLVIAYI